MASISSTSGAQSAISQGWQQLQLQQARRTAEQAEVQARALKTQADGAQREADRAQETARDLTVRSDQAQAGASQARQGLAAIRSREQMEVRLSQTVGEVATRQAAAATVATTATVASPSPAAASAAAPVLNTQGQVTGTVINTTA